MHTEHPLFFVRPSFYCHLFIFKKPVLPPITKMVHRREYFKIWEVEVCLSVFGIRVVPLEKAAYNLVGNL